MTSIVKKLSTKTSLVSLAPRGFFDDENSDPNPAFWSKDPINIEPKKLGLVNGFYFYKKSKKKFGELKQVFVGLYKHYLVTSKTKEGLSKQYKSVDLDKHFVSLQRMSVSSSKYATGIMLFYNQKHVELFSKSMEDLNNFLYHFKKHLVQINFDDMYVLDKKLGSGSYASVYRVRDKLTRREYAAKFFEISSFRDIIRGRISLKNEINIHRQLEHGNICRLHEVFETPTNVVIVMEYAQGQRLLDYVIEKAPLPEKEVIIIFKELLEAVLYVHTLGIIHRDIKMENVVINKEQKGTERLSIKLIDFGLSVTSNNIELFKKSGTPGYVAPEILIADTYDTQVDVFSMGVILFTMLSGRSPFVGPDRQTVLKLNKNCEYTFKPKQWDNKSTNAKDLVRKMMEANPQKRITIKEALTHKWIAASSINAFQSLKTLPKDNNNTMSTKRSLENASNEVRSVDRGIEKSKTLSEKTAEKRLPHVPQRASQYYAKRSSTSKPVERRYTNKSSFSKKETNLLQIPENDVGPGSTDGEEEKSRFDFASDGINKGTIRTFYRLTSEANSEGPTSPKERRFTTAAGAPNHEIPSEVPDIQEKILSMGEIDKTNKSPFRKTSNIHENQRINHGDSTNLSCNISYESDDPTMIQIPASPNYFKASMGYIKRTSTLAKTMTGSTKMKSLTCKRQLKSS